MNSQFEDPLILLQCCQALLRLGTPNKHSYLEPSPPQEDFKDTNCISMIKKDQNKIINSLSVQARSKLQTVRSSSAEKHTKEREDTTIISELELKGFMNKRPKPSWGKRLEKLNLYNPNYIHGWCPNLSKIYESTDPGFKNKIPKKIILNKSLFTKYADLTTKTTSQKDWTKNYKSSQRGIEEYFKRNHYQKLERYTRKNLQFILKKN
ncbi:hypothetical protein M0812_28736 [Anaeramoeba flamelloides]|uniref:Uncharacterized protein n=1 Tax=Anaeramoeba flamelloides TaxID=1746091 RepID=A0AAV7Y8Z0_9EUKA|nr:hypothetical protein M0812_28736 [Anaeramoeba flamelloides]